MGAEQSAPVDRDADLLAALTRGDPAAYEQLVRDHGGRLLAVARRFLRNEEDARDAVQDAFLQAWRNIERFEGRASLGTWLHRIAVNAALMKLRSRRRKGEESIDALMPEFDADQCRVEPLWQLDESVESLVERQQVRDLVHESIDRLPDAYRTVLLLRDIEGYDTAEVAALLDASPEAIKTRLHRARSALKKLLEPVYSGDGP